MNIYGGSNDDSGVVIKSAGELDIGGNKIVNLKAPIAHTDAATAGWVHTFTLHLNNAKVEWSGGTNTGDLSIGNHKLTDFANPENDGDAANKQYVDAAIKQFDVDRPYNLGRCIVFQGETKTYFSVRAKKNVDLDSGLEVEIRNGNNTFVNCGHLKNFSMLPDLKICEHIDIGSLNAM